MRKPNMQRYNDSPPVKMGEELDVRVEAVGEKGDGVAKVKGFVLFIPNTRAGENCRVRVTKVLSKVGFAEKIGEASAPVREEMQSREIPDYEPEPSPEDSDDFGSDLDEEDEFGDESDDEVEDRDTEDPSEGDGTDSEEEDN
jgi:predicted RNA-binding protein with TRAM domain